MFRPRIIPSLLLHHGGLVKTMQFGNPKYVGDPINAIKIFNDKEVDELMVMDIDASREERGPKWDILGCINREAFMPLAYGGGIRTTEDVQRILSLGYEKIVINHYALLEPKFISRSVAECGSQSVVVCIDVKRDFWGRGRVYDHVRRKCSNLVPVDWAKRAEELGAGEIIIYSVDREGTFGGYDIPLIQSVSCAVGVPVVALGGAGKHEDFVDAVKSGGAAAVAAGSMFVFQGPHRAVLISYPLESELNFNV